MALASQKAAQKYMHVGSIPELLYTAPGAWVASHY
jgi:hypothetical protein